MRCDYFPTSFLYKYTLILINNRNSCVEEECYLNAIVNDNVKFKAFLRLRVLEYFESQTATLRLGLSIKQLHYG